jgi:hypothetical protein
LQGGKEPTLERCDFLEPYREKPLIGILVNNENLVLSCLFTVLGLALIVFSKQLARFALWLDKTAGIERNPFQYKLMRVIYILGGLTLSFLGIRSWWVIYFGHH